MSFILKDEFASTYPVFQREQLSYPGRATTNFNLMDLKLGLSGQFRGLAVGGLTALGDASLNK